MNMVYGKCWDWYMAYICSTWYVLRMLLADIEFLFLYSTQDLTCLLREILSWTLAEKFHINSRSYLFAAWYIELNSCREIPYLCMSTYYSICICWLFFLIVFLTLGNIPIGPESIFFIFYLFVLHLKWDILLTWFDSKVFSMVNSFFLTTDGLYSSENGNRWRFPSPWLGSPGRHTCTEIICSKYRQGKRRAKIQTSETNPSTWYNSQKIQGSF